MKNLLNDSNQTFLLGIVLGMVFILSAWCYNCPSMLDDNRVEIISIERMYTPEQPYDGECWGHIDLTK